MDDNPLNINLDAIDKSNWDVGPANRWAYRNIDKILKVEIVDKGDGAASEFERSIQDLTGISFKTRDGRTTTVGAHINHSYTDGLMVLHQGKVVFENYYDGLRDDSLHLSQSVCKSVVGILAGILIDQGKLEPAKLITDYVPDLKEGGYAGCTVGQLLNMRTGVHYEEDYDNPSREYLLLEQCAGWSERGIEDAPSSYKEFLKIIKPESAHGGPFHYRSIDTDVLGWVCENAGGASLAEVISAELWQKLGCEHDAKLTVDPEGTAIANGGYNASLRDYARFGQMVLGKGLFNGQRIVSESWINASLRGDKAAFAAGYPDYRQEFPNAAYANQWWVLDVDNQIHAAIGIHGQFVYVDHGRDVVIVKLSTWPTAANADLEIDDLRMMAKIASVLAD